MRRIFGNNLSWLLSSVMIVSILWLGVFGIIAMNHTSGMHSGCLMDFIGSNADSQPMGSSFCANIHMGMVQELAHAIPKSIDFGIGIASIVSLVFLLVTRVRSGDEGIDALCRVRYRDRFDKDTYSFFSQIKQWISSYKKGDFLYCPA